MTDMTPEEQQAEDDRLYKSLFGDETPVNIAELRPGASSTEPDESDDALYRALFG